MQDGTELALIMFFLGPDTNMPILPCIKAHVSFDLNSGLAWDCRPCVFTWCPIPGWGRHMCLASVCNELGSVLESLAYITSLPAPPLANFWEIFIYFLPPKFWE